MVAVADIVTDCDIQDVLNPSSSETASEQCDTFLMDEKTSTQKSFQWHFEELDNAHTAEPSWRLANKGDVVNGKVYLMEEMQIRN